MSFVCDLCEYETKYNSNLTKHKALKHNIDVTWCMCDLCEYKTKQNSHLTQHKANKHDIDIIWHQCNLCEYKAKQKSNLTTHKALKHKIDVTWFQCDLCEYKAKTNGNLTKHKANIHNIDVTYYECSECDYKAKKNSHLSIHKAYKHDIGVIWYLCNLCEFKTKDNGVLIRHKANKHDINVTYYKCNECEFKAKQNSSLTRHKSNIHGINLTWYQCSECDFKTKTRSYLKNHTIVVHDIGEQECCQCLEKHACKDKFKGGNMCKKCYKELVGKESRIELVISNYLDNNFGTEYLLSSDKSLKSLGGCQSYRPDKLYTSPDLNIIVEIDEHQHRSYNCDLDRLMKIYSESTSDSMCIIRFNPDRYEGTVHINDRKKALVELLKKVVTKKFKGLKIIYMYYDEHNCDMRYPFKLIPPAL